MLSLRFASHVFPFTRRLVVSQCIATSFLSLSHRNPKNISCSVKSIEQNEVDVSSLTKDSPLSGLDEILMGYFFGKKKATEVAHLVWKHVVQKGDEVIDATCGNGYDTLAMVKMVAGESSKGRVYAMDVQEGALVRTSSLLDKSLSPNEKEVVSLYPICHSKMEEVVPLGSSVRLVAFNLGYLPGSDKSIATRSDTTVIALEAAKKMLLPGGLISVIAYVGHPGGRDEFEAVQAFASGLSVENWICCKFEMLNRASAPVLIFLSKR